MAESSVFQSRDPPQRPYIKVWTTFTTIHGQQRGKTISGLIVFYTLSSVLGSEVGIGSLLGCYLLLNKILRTISEQDTLFC